MTKKQTSNSFYWLAFFSWFLVFLPFATALMHLFGLLFFAGEFFNGEATTLIIYFIIGGALVALIAYGLLIWKCWLLIRCPDQDTRGGFGGILSLERELNKYCDTNNIDGARTEPWMISLAIFIAILGVYTVKLGLLLSFIIYAFHVRQYAHITHNILEFQQKKEKTGYPRWE